MKETNKKKKPIILDIARDGKGISKKAPLNPAGLKRFFMTFKDNFGKLILVNMIKLIIVLKEEKIILATPKYII